MRISTNSYQQLKKDFVRFPEEGLTHENNLSSNQFDIVYYGRWRRLLISIYFFNKLFMGLLRDLCGVKRTDVSLPLNGQLAEVNPATKSLNELLGALKLKIKDEFHILSQPFSNSSFLAKCVIYTSILIVCLVFFILFLPVFLIFFLVKLTFVIKKIDKNLQKNGGFYNGRLSHAVIYVSKKCCSEQCQEMTASHEHIHLLQAKFSVKNYTEINVPSIDHCFSWLLSSDTVQLDNLKYLMHRHETEARLHEIVVHYIRQGFPMPFSSDGFVEMLSKFKWLNIFTVPGCKLLSHDSGLVTRCERIDLDIFNIISALNKEYVHGYVNGVLSVMYANLLGYYGYQDAKKDMLDSIGSFDLYNRLYGIE